MSDSDDKITLSDSDHQAIADKLFEKAQPKGDDDDDKPATSQVKLSDDDHKGIAAHIVKMTQEQAEQDKKDKPSPTPPAPENLFERSLFAIGGGRRAS